MAKNKTEDNIYAKAGLKFRPMDFVIKDSFIELKSNREAMIEGSKGVLEYRDNIIRIALKEFIVSFSGRNLKLKCISPTSLTIEGIILGIEFTE